MTEARECEQCGATYSRSPGKSGHLNKRYCSMSCRVAANKAAAVAKWHISADGRICERCLVYRQADELYPNRSRVGGWHGSCRSCQSDHRLSRIGKPTKSQTVPCGECGEHFLRKHAHEKLCSDACRGVRDSRLRRNNRLKRNYGVDTAWYERTLLQQQGVCAICRDPTATAFTCDRLVIDHRHGDGRVRGLLCGGCNSGLGYFRDNPDFLVRATSYLRKYDDRAAA